MSSIASVLLGFSDRREWLEVTGIRAAVVGIAWYAYPRLVLAINPVHCPDSLGWGTIACAGVGTAIAWGVARLEILLVVGVWLLYALVHNARVLWGVRRLRGGEAYAPR